MNIFVEGNIGAGKTTLTTLLGSLIPSSSVTLEPVKEWMEQKNDDGRNLLEMFYSDISRYSYLFQSVAFRTRIQSMEKTIEKTMNESKEKYNFFERSVFADRYCFAENCYESGKMSKIEYNDYISWFDWLAKNFKFNEKIHGFIYVKTTPEIAHQRIVSRNRHGEETIPFEYLKALSDKHEKMFKLLEEKYPVLVVDGDLDFKNNKEIQQNIAEQVIKFWQKEQLIKKLDDILLDIVYLEYNKENKLEIKTDNKYLEKLYNEFLKEKVIPNSTRFQNKIIKHRDIITKEENNDFSVYDSKLRKQSLLFSLDNNNIEESNKLIKFLNYLDDMSQK
jgi:deoxyadenosine/deoxycytidine kinase